MKQKFRFYFLTALVFIVSTAFSQQGRGRYTDDGEYVENRDSTYGVDFDFSALDPASVRMNVLTYKLAKIKAYNDSMMTVIRNRNIRERTDSLEMLYDLLARDTTTDYNAYSFFVGQFHSSIGGLNKSLASAGWSKLPDVSYHFTNVLDFTWKRKRFINDVFVSVGSARSVSKGDVTVSYNYLSLLNYYFGYALLDKKRIQFFPYAGLNYQRSDLSFTNTYLAPFTLGTAVYDTLLNAAANNKQGVEYKFRKREVVLDAGAELDIHIIYSKRKTGFILGFRGGKCIPLVSSGWQQQGEKYAKLNDVSIRDYHYEVVLRVYARRAGKRGAYYLKTNWWENGNY